MTALLIAAASGRALAASARRGGYVPLVADFFGDQDTAELAEDHVRLGSGLARGMTREELFPALDRLAAGRRPLGIVCGTGFEDRPDLLKEIARRWTLFGTTPEAVARIKDPTELVELCRSARIPHPETTRAPPGDPAGWLAKREGGAGGRHVIPAAHHDPSKHSFYYQRWTDGVPVSALVLSDGDRMVVLGFTEQWASPREKQPFRYGGAVRPASISSAMAAELSAAIERLFAAVRLIGLNSADFLVDGERFQLLEINPRPGATMDLFEPSHGSLFAMHVAACRGRMPEAVPRLEGTLAAAIVYAEADIESVPDLEWPAWTADRPRAGSVIKTGEPICTVHAAHASAAAAKHLVHARTAAISAETMRGCHEYAAG
jgi:predicted ATP-grasp superfamily ATP-dependent carboligase